MKGTDARFNGAMDARRTAREIGKAGAQAIGRDDNITPSRQSLPHGLKCQDDRITNLHKVGIGIS
ncbi:MAG: hypothetical protein KGL63_12560, partial [Betaproteobacteria bacterium]|nr:hypothetical protein [Betaproteobacteria bacterium]